MPRDNRLLASFGRRRGRKLGPRKQQLLDTLLPRIAIEPSTLSANQMKQLLSGWREVWLEIGFGGGEHLAAQAKNNPDVLMIGCEPYINGIVGLLADIEQEQITNIRVFSDDVRDLLPHLPPQALARIFILFPDPWPKQRHHKRRLITLQTLAALAAVQPPGAELLLATDHSDYAAWMLEKLLACPHYQWQAQRPDDWRIPPSGWVTTRYQAKAEAEGIEPLFISARRRAV